MKPHKPELLVSTEVNGNKVCLFRTYRGNSKYWYHIHWGKDTQSKMEVLTPKGNRSSGGGAIKQFFQVVKAAKHLTFSKI